MGKNIIKYNKLWNELIIMCSGVFPNPDRSEWGKNKKSTVFVLALIWDYPSSGIIPVEAADSDQEHLSAIRYSKYHFIILLIV